MTETIKQTLRDSDLIGWILNEYCITGYNSDGSATYHYTMPELVFSGFGFLAIIVALLLKRESTQKGYGLEKPNINDLNTRKQISNSKESGKDFLDSEIPSFNELTNPDPNNSIDSRG